MYLGGDVASESGVNFFEEDPLRQTKMRALHDAGDTGCSLRRREMPSVAIYGKNFGLKVVIHLIEANQCTETGTHTCVGAVRCSGEVVSENEDFSHESLLTS
jgi:hypothetical protein